MTRFGTIYGAIAIISVAGLACAADTPAGDTARLPQLAAIGKEYKELYNHTAASMVRLEVSQNGAAVLDAFGLKDEFEKWSKSAGSIPGLQNGASGGGGRSGRGSGGGGGSDRTDRAGRSGRGSENPPSFGRSTGFGGPGGGSMANQVRAFLQYKIGKTEGTDAARLRGLVLRLDLNRNGFQGELAAILLDKEGHILLPTGLIREAHSEPLKVVLAEGAEPVTAKFVGTNLTGGYSILQLDKVAATLKPAALSPDPITPGDMLLSVSASQWAAQLVFVSSRIAVPADDRSGSFLFDINGKLAGLATGGNWPADRQAQQAVRLTREIDSIIKTGKDIEQRSLGIAFVPLTRDVVRNAKLTKLLSGRTGVIVTQVEPQSLAATAGLKEKDVILSIDGRPIRSLVSGDGGPLSELVQLQIDLASRHGTVALGIIRDEPTGDREETLQMNLDTPATSAPAKAE